MQFINSYTLSPTVTSLKCSSRLHSVGCHRSSLHGSFVHHVARLVVVPARYPFRLRSPDRAKVTTFTHHLLRSSRLLIVQIACLSHLVQGSLRIFFFASLQLVFRLNHSRLLPAMGCRWHMLQPSHYSHLFVTSLAGHRSRLFLGFACSSRHSATHYSLLA